ncbi:putative glycolipid-binding domain-containing protein [Goodfellowiella coeruleoviolacea]|uniref:putative glycolipid-binding domain-containing protein n=1 Tax=Goodfellowiella coeruleoviolacea TaxID=334858 RepID=UPI0020A236BC|nr:putative glycolipid-binding domain-containing protein [Goodfellowiella coeruleoviolacea]
MSDSETAAQVGREDAAAAPSAPARRPTMLTWQGVGASSLESVRLMAGGDRLRASGRLISGGTGAHRGALGAEAGDTGQAYSASFELSTDKAGRASRLLLRSTTAEDERQVAVSRTQDGLWLVDRGQGAERAEFDGALDVDVAGSVLFNGLPVRRLDLHRDAGDQELPVVRVSLPDLSVHLVRQRYRTVRVGENYSLIHFSCAGHTADLTVDGDGMVLDFPGLARRV